MVWSTNYLLNRRLVYPFSVDNSERAATTTGYLRFTQAACAAYGVSRIDPLTDERSAFRHVRVFTGGISTSTWHSDLNKRR